MGAGVKASAQPSCTPHFLRHSEPPSDLLSLARSQLSPNALRVTRRTPLSQAGTTHHNSQFNHYNVSLNHHSTASISRTVLISNLLATLRCLGRTYLLQTTLDRLRLLPYQCQYQHQCQRRLQCKSGTSAVGHRGLRTRMKGRESFRRLTRSPIYHPTIPTKAVLVILLSSATLMRRTLQGCTGLTGSGRWGLTDI